MSFIQRLFSSPEAKEDGAIAETLWTALVSLHRTRDRMRHEFMLKFVKRHPHLIGMTEEGYGIIWAFSDELTHFRFLMIRGTEDTGLVTASGEGKYMGISSKIGWTSEKMTVDIMPNALKRARRLGEILSEMPGSYLMPRSS